MIPESWIDSFSINSNNETNVESDAIGSFPAASRYNRIYDFMVGTPRLSKTTNPRALGALSQGLCLLRELSVAHPSACRGFFSGTNKQRRI